MKFKTKWYVNWDSNILCSMNCDITKTGSSASLLVFNVLISEFGLANKWLEQCSVLSFPSHQCSQIIDCSVFTDQWLFSVYRSVTFQCSVILSKNIQIYQTWDRWKSVMDLRIWNFLLLAHFLHIEPGDLHGLRLRRLDAGVYLRHLWSFWRRNGCRLTTGFSDQLLNGDPGFRSNLEISSEKVVFVIVGSRVGFGTYMRAEDTLLTAIDWTNTGEGCTLL